MAAIPGFDPLPLDDYEPLLVSTKEQLDKYWPYMKPLIDKCVKRAMKGEMTTEDIHTMILQQKVNAFIVRSDKCIQPDVKLVVIVELVPYPKLAAMNILVLSGTELEALYEKFWVKLCGWMYMNGVRTVEGWVTPAMQRVISRFGFKPAYTLMRLDLSEA
jgi:hypothetical protein